MGAEAGRGTGLLTAGEDAQPGEGRGGTGPGAAPPVPVRWNEVLNPEVLESLSRCSFQDAMTIIDRIVPVDAHAGRTPPPAEERVRYRAHPHMAFAAGDIETIEPLPEDPSLIAVNVNFLGLHGPSSPLPPHYAERIAQRGDEHEALRDFFDFFNHRLISLLRRIWLRWRYHLRYRPGGRDPISRRILCLAGLSFEAESERREGQEAEAPMLLPEVGLLSLYTRSAAVIATVLTNYFRVKVELVEFVRREVDIPPAVRGRLGQTGMRLGTDFIAGARVPDSLGKYRVRIGPVSLARFRAFLPGGRDHPRLVRLVSLMQNQPLEWDLELLLVEGEARQMRLGRAQLGWTSWIGAPPAAVAPVRVSLSEESQRGEGP